MGNLKKFFTIVTAIVNWTEAAFVCFLLVAMVLLACVQIFLRTFYSSGIFWADPLLRYMVIWAGLFFQMVLFAMAVFGWRMTVIGTGVNHLFWLTANVCFLMLLFNFNPLIKLDGYYFLSEWVNIPNLRSTRIILVHNALTIGT